MSTRRLAAIAAVLGALALALGTAAPATASLSQDAAVQKAAALPAVQRAIAGKGNVQASVTRQDSDWIVTFVAGEHVPAQVELDVLTGDVGHVFTGETAEFPLARGSESGFAARKVNSLWVFLPLTLVFLLAFVDLRRPWRLLHLDLLVIALLGVSFAFYMDGDLRTSMTLVYPVLIYVVARMLIAGFRPQRRAGPLTWLPVRWLIGVTLGLVAARIVFTLADPYVVDIGYGSAGGANRILDGLDVYTRGGNNFDTYGPLTYIAYIPFVLVWPFNELNSFAPAAQAAAIAWDLITVAGLVVLGRSLRPGTNLGWALALAWAACPFTGLSMAVGSNDTLVPALLVWAFVGLRSAAVSGALTAGAAAAKIAPAFMAPVMARGTGPLEWRRIAWFTLAFALITAATLGPLVPDGGVREVYDATIGFQLHRDSPFSIWSQHDGLHTLQSVLKAASLALALALAVFPRGARSVGQVAALGTAVLVAGEIPLQHWFYLYVPWFLPLYCVALFSEQIHAADEPRAS